MAKQTNRAFFLISIFFILETGWKVGNREKRKRNMCASQKRNNIIIEHSRRNELNWSPSYLFTDFFSRISPPYFW